MRPLWTIAAAVACTNYASVDDTGVVDEGDTELSCDDGADNDADSLADCDDSDCDGAVSCTWPTALSLDGRFDFEANFVAELGGVTDCSTHYTSALAHVRPMDCASCDRVFYGPFTYVSDDCPDDPENPRPTEGGYGFAFTSEAVWEVWFQDLDATWLRMGNANDDGTGVHVFQQTDPAEYENTEIGEITTTFRITEP